LDVNEAEPKENALVVNILLVAALGVVDELSVVPIIVDFGAEQGTVFKLPNDSPVLGLFTAEMDIPESKSEDFSVLSDCPMEIEEVVLKFFSIDIEKGATGVLETDLSASDSV